MRSECRNITNRRARINGTDCALLRTHSEKCHSQMRMRSEGTRGLSDYWSSAIRSELQASLPVYLVRSARTVWSSAALLDNRTHSKVQQAIATSAEAAKIRTAIRSNLLRRGEASVAQTFHKRVSGSVSTLGRLSDDGSVATRAHSSFNRQSDRLGSVTIKKSAVVIMCVALCQIISVHWAANAALTHVHKDCAGRVSEERRIFCGTQRSPVQWPNRV
jgi:hypothetical protein